MVEGGRRVADSLAANIHGAPLIVKGSDGVAGAGQRVHPDRFLVLVPELFCVVVQGLQHFPLQAYRSSAGFAVVGPLKFIALET